MLKLNDPSLLKSQCLVDGAWIGEGVDAVDNPATGEVLAKVPRFRRRRDDARRRGRVPRLQALGPQERQGALGHPAQMVRPDHGQPGGPGPDHDRRAGQAAGRGARRGRLRRLLRRVLRRGGQAHLRRDDSLALPEFAHHRAEAAGRRLRRDHALELPGRDDHPQMLARPRRRLHRRGQAGARHAADGAGAGGAGRARRHSPRACSTSSPATPRRSAR